jgi:hypothetical protein
MFALRPSSNSRRAFRAWLSSTTTRSRAFWDCSSSALVSKENNQSDVSQQTHKKARMELGCRAYSRAAPTTAQSSYPSR